MSAALVASLLLQASQAAVPPERPPPSNADLPAWSRAPTAAEMAAAYPAEAAKANFAGSATLECTIGPGGGLVDCVAVDEAGPGFGAAALSVAPGFRLPTKAPSGASTVGRTVQFPIHWLNPAKSEAAAVVYDDSGRSGSVGFNCRVKEGRGLDNCVVVDAKPRGTQLFGPAGEAALRFRAPSRSAPGTRILLVVEIKPR